MIDAQRTDNTAVTIADYRERADRLRSGYGARASAADSLKAAVADMPRATNLMALLTLTRLGKHIYAGTVPGAVRQRRRAANKRARVQRRVDRRANFRKGVR